MWVMTGQAIHIMPGTTIPSAQLTHHSPSFAISLLGTGGKSRPVIHTSGSHLSAELPHQAISVQTSESWKSVESVDGVECIQPHRSDLGWDQGA